MWVCQILGLAGCNIVNLVEGFVKVRLHGQVHLSIIYSKVIDRKHELYFF